MVAAMLLGACSSVRGGGGSGGPDGDDDGTPVASDISASATFPFMEMAAGPSGELIYPTSLAHLLGGSVEADWWGGDTACVEIQNAGSAAVRVEVTARLVGYSESVSELLDIAAGDDASSCMNPVPDLEALYALSSETNAQVSVRINDASSGALYWQENEDVRVATRHDTFFTMNGAPARSSIAAFVRPDADGVIAVLDDMVELSWFGGTIGVGGYRAHADPPPNWPVTTVSIGAGNYESGWASLEAGETVTFSAVSSGSDSWLYLMTASEHEKLRSGQPFLVLWQSEIDDPAWGSFTAVSSGNYFMVAYNYSSIFSESVTWTSSMTRADNVLDYLFIIYDYLQRLGINYLNVPGNFFEGSQQCLLPDEVIENGGGNCIDGTMLFASLLEQIGVRPIITFIPGHAFVSVDVGPAGKNTVWSLETTMMGSGASFWEALSMGVAEHSDAVFDGDYFLDLYIDEARTAGVLPMP